MSDRSVYFVKVYAIEERIFTERNVRFYGSGVLIAVVISVFLVWLGVFPGELVAKSNGKLGTIDFCWIWASGKLAASGNTAALFEQATFAAVHDTLLPSGQCLYLPQYVYPPTFLFFTYPLGFLPYLAAFVIWVGATVVLYEATVYSIVPRAAALVAALAAFSSLKNIQLGHNGFLSAGLIGLTLLCLERRPWLAGIFLGLLSCKPQFGVLFPLVLIVTRNWRALASATATTVILGIAAAIVFGPEGWQSFVHVLLHRTSGLSPQPGVTLAIESVYGWLHVAGAGEYLSWAVHVSIAVATAVWVCIVWLRPMPHALKAAVLCMAVVLVTPYILPYDLCILSVAVAFLVQDGLARGFLPGERLVILACFGGLAVIAAAAAPIICAALLVLAARRSIAGTLPLARVAS